MAMPTDRVLLHQTPITAAFLMVLIEAMVSEPFLISATLGYIGTEGLLLSSLYDHASYWCPTSGVWPSTNSSHILIVAHSPLWLP